jgi:BirA family biotin operon repressor/biotin-[acetyl-CoA-carboxylase] ligase
VPEVLDPNAIQSGLRTRVIGKRVLCFQQMDSTNAYLMDLASKGEPEGTVVLAEEQTAGRGRFGRTWKALPVTSLLVSVLLRPRLSLANSCKLSLIAALAVRRTLQEVATLTSTIKWPNDVLVNGRKVCGILAETTTSADQSSMPALVLGIGLNVNQDREDFPDEFRDQATSLRIEADRKQGRLPLLLNLLSSLEDLYLAFEQNGFSPLLGELRQSSAVIAKRVTVQVGAYNLEGTVEDLDEDGRLLMRLDTGSTTILTSGEVTSIRPL